MTANDVIRSALDLSDRVITSYLSDLSDADLTMTPVDGMNPIAWQLGHLISAERHFVELVAPGTCPKLPDQFETAHGKDVPHDAKGYLSKDAYLKLWQDQRAATRSVLDKQTESDLDRADAAFPPFAPTVGALLSMCAMHPTMHAGQFVAVRRKTGKPVVI